MSDDARAIRHLIETWIASSRAGETEKVLTLMSDDVLFMVPGRKPFGKEAFAAASSGMKDMRIDGKSDIEEIVVVGDWAYCRTFLTVAITAPDGKTTQRSGCTLSILRKQAGGEWRLVRDANMLASS